MFQLRYISLSLFASTFFLGCVGDANPNNFNIINVAEPQIFVGDESLLEAASTDGYDSALFGSRLVLDRPVPVIWAKAPTTNGTEVISNAEARTDTIVFRQDDVLMSRTLSEETAFRLWLDTDAELNRIVVKTDFAVTFDSNEDGDSWKTDGFIDIEPAQNRFDIRVEYGAAEVFESFVVGAVAREVTTLELVNDPNSPEDEPSLAFLGIAPGGPSHPARVVRSPVETSE
ncbi:MAG: hypothetical protein MK135_07280 [Polyangiaceae bacterium]|nr:hypothetical protein [Polyangiaceae bacterium]